MSALQEERSAETRRRLLDATVACLFERGYAGTTTTEIAARAGVSRGAQLHHFPKKDELVVSALEYVFELRLAEMSAAIADPPSGSREHRLAVLIDTIWPGSGWRPEFFRSFSDPPYSSPSRNIFQNTPFHASCFWS